MKTEPTKRPVTIGRVTPTRRRAVFTLFVAGWDMPSVGRLFRIPKPVVEEVIRRAGRRGR